MMFFCGFKWLFSGLWFFNGFGRFLVFLFVVVYFLNWFWMAFSGCGPVLDCFLVVLDAFLNGFRRTTDRSKTQVYAVV